MRRLLWVNYGHMERGHSKQKLEAIAERYASFDLVPDHYRFPELWSSTEKPRFEKKLDAMFSR